MQLRNGERRTVWWEGWPSSDRPLYLEMVEIDEANGVAEFYFELDSADTELWLGTVEGIDRNPEVVEELQEATTANWIAESKLTIPLSSKPQVTQIEVRSSDLTSTRVFRITTRGKDAQSFRYRIEDDSEAADAERLVWRIEGDELVGYTPDEGMESNGEWEVDGDDLVFDTDAVVESARSAINGAESIVIYTPETV